MEALPEELPHQRRAHAAGRVCVAGRQRRDVGPLGRRCRGGSGGDLPGWGAGAGAPRATPPVPHTPQAVVKGDTASLSKDSQSPLNL